MTLSKRHHYLPQVYLKGFTQSDGMLAVYDIQKKELKKGWFSPKQVFFEWNRNTFDIDNSQTDFLEDLYKNIDQNVTPVLKKIQSSSSNPELSPYDYFNLIFFQGVTYWRIPSTDTDIVNHVRTTDRKDLFIKLINTETNEDASNEIYEEIIKEQAFIELYRIPKAIFDYLRSTKKSLLDTWKITYSTGPPSLHLIGDNPILTLEDSFDNIFDTESIFPLTSNKALWHLDSAFPKIIPREMTLTIDQLIFLQSERYVCGPDPNYLKAIADLSNGPYNDNIIRYLKHQVFGKI
jgi:hypothetical protein